MRASRLPWVLREFERSAGRRSTYAARVGVLVPPVIITLQSLGVRRFFTPIEHMMMVFSVLGGFAFTLWLMGRSVNLPSLARERKLGTLDVLLITPLRPIEIVLSKFLPRMSAFLFPFFGTLPWLMVWSWAMRIPFAICLAWYVWVASLWILCVSVWAGASCLETDERNPQTLAFVSVVFMLVGSAMVHSWWPGWWWLEWMNPFLGRWRGRASVPACSRAIAWNLALSLLLLSAAARSVGRYTKPVRGRVSMGIHRFHRWVKRLTPGRIRAERWILTRYPLAWLSLRRQSVLAMIVLGAVGVLIVGFLIHAMECEHLYQFAAVMFPLDFILFVVVAVSVESSRKVDFGQRMMETQRVLPLTPRQIIVNRIVACGVGVGTGFVLTSLMAMGMVGWLAGWVWFGFVLLAIAEAALLMVMACLGTHIGSQHPRPQPFDERIGLCMLLGVQLVTAIVSVASLPARGAVENLYWLVASLVRIAVDMMVLRALYEWLVRRIQSGEDVGEGENA